MNRLERIINITECAARVLNRPQVIVTTICTCCELPSGTLAVSPEQAGLRFDRMHLSCAAAYRARLVGAPVVLA